MIKEILEGYYTQILMQLAIIGIFREKFDSTSGKLTLTTLGGKKYNSEGTFTIEGDFTREVAISCFKKSLRFLLKKKMW